MQTWRPQPTLRQKKEIPFGATDVDIFRSMPLGDVWLDAQLPEVYRYLRSNQKLIVPDSWEVALGEFDAALEAAYPQSMKAFA